MKRLGLIALLSSLGGSPAAAQWTVTSLHPSGAVYSFATSVADGQQAGFIIGDTQRASLWSGTAASWVDLTPVEADSSFASDVGGGRQVGSAVIGGIQRASLWTGTAASRVDLHPAGALFSHVYGVDGDQQAGHALIGLLRAVLWTGSAASWVDLNPVGSTQSEAYGVSGGQQVGYAMVGGVSRASLWTGTAASWVDLSPPEASDSSAYDVGDGQQVGSVRISGAWHASLWTGTAESRVDLNPTGATEAFAYDVGGGEQVGAVTIGGTDRASLWSGSATTWVDLHAFLPPQFERSYAYGIAHDGASTTVVGWGFNGATGLYEALLWIRGSCLPPIADAGPDVTCDEGTPVSLDGSQSTDPNGEPLAFVWTQVAGPTVTLDLDEPAHPSFTAPIVALGGATLTFSLVVTNDCELDSQSDIVNVTVANVNHSPEALAGDDQIVAEASPVTLNGSESFDADGDLLFYSWSQTTGPTVSLNLSDSVRPTFTAPLVGPIGATLAFELTVSDGMGSGTDSVSIVVENVNHSPVANAGPDQTRNEGALTILDGASSSDPDGDPVAFAWTQITGPAVVLSNAASASPSFVAPQVGPSGVSLVFQLVVDDGLAASLPDPVTVHVRDVDQPPDCNHARPSQGSLWPPNHKLVPIQILGVTDPDDPSVTITITSVTQDEPVNGLGDGDTGPDAVLQGSTVLIRAERAGNGNGRVYTIHFTASDGRGGTSAGSVQVKVPHDMGHGGDAVDDGQWYGST